MSSLMLNFFSIFMVIVVMISEVLLQPKCMSTSNTYKRFPI